MTVLISRSEALESGQSHYFTGKPCKRGHFASRRVGNRECVECHKEYMRTRPEKNRVNVARWREKNPDYYREKYRNDPEERERCRTKWKSECKQKAAARRRRWRENNPEEAKARNAATEKSRRRQTPPWADRSAILEIYRECRRVSSSTGVKHHVDHVIPLNGEQISGLHVAGNLRIIPASENMAKGNKVPPVMRAFAA